MGGYGMNVLDPVMDEEDLSSPLELSQDRLPDDFFIIADDEGTNGEAIFWGGLNQTEIPYTGDSHLKGSWNGRGREGDDVDQFSHLFQFFFVGNPETVFLVDDQKPQIPEFNVLR